MAFALAVLASICLGSVVALWGVALRSRAARRSPRVARRRAALKRSVVRLGIARDRVRASRRSLSRARSTAGRRGRLPLLVGSAIVAASLAAPFFRPADPDAPSVGSGTGFKVAEGFGVTNDHVAGKCDRVQVEVAGGFEDVKVVSLDESSDLAVITLPKGMGGDPLPVRAWPPLGLGDTVYTLGFPLTASLQTGARLHSGMVSGLTGHENDASEVQFSGSIYPGNSGSALLDDRGNVVGVASSMLGRAGGYNFATRAYALLNLLRAVQVPTAPERTQPWDPRTAEASVLKSVFAVRCERD